MKFQYLKSTRATFLAMNQIVLLKTKNKIRPLSPARTKRASSLASLSVLIEEKKDLSQTFQAIAKSMKNKFLL